MKLITSCATYLFFLMKEENFEIELSEDDSVLFKLVTISIITERVDSDYEEWKKKNDKNN